MASFSPGLQLVKQLELIAGQATPLTENLRNVCCTLSGFESAAHCMPCHISREDRKMNAIDLLRKDHETVKGLLDRLSSTTERGVKTRVELLHKIEQELMVHTDIEEEIFYPAYKEAGKKEQAVMTAEAKEEHRTVDSLVLPDLLNTDPASVEFSGRVKVLKELLEHHIEEEEKELFPEARRLLGAEQLKELGKAMEARKTLMKKSLQAKAA